MDYRDQDLSDAEFKRRNGFSRNDIEKVEQTELDDQNRMEYGASRRGGFTTVGLEKAAKFLKEKKAEEARQARSREMGNNHTRWMWVSEPETGEDNLIEILLDTQSDGNFMTEDMANDYKLLKEELRRPITFNMAVGEVTCSSRVRVEWAGIACKHGATQFYILPQESRIEKPLLGADSMAEFQDFLLTEPPKHSLKYTALKKKTTDEEAREKQTREQAMADRATLAGNKKKQQEKGSEKQSEEVSSSRSKKD